MKAKKILTRVYLLCAITMLTLLASCSKDKDGVARDLLASVPSNSGAVAVIDCEQMIEKAGGGQQVLAFFNKNAKLPEMQNTLAALADAWNPQAAVVFTDGYYMYITCLLDSPDKLRTALEAKGMKFSEEQGVTCSDAVAICGNKAWFLWSKGKIDPMTIKGYADLSEKQSFLSSDYLEELLKGEKDITFITDVDSMISRFAGNSMQSNTMARMAVSTVFKDASYVAGDVRFLTGKLEAQAKVLDSKYHPAKFLLPYGKVDEATVARMGGSAGVLGALSFTKSLGKKISDTASSFGGGLPLDVKGSVSALDGTIVIAMGNGGEKECRAVITTAGDQTSELSQVVASFGAVSTEGNLMFLNRDMQTPGTLDVAAQAPKFKNAIAGIVMSATPDKGLIYMMMHPAGNSIRLDITNEYPGSKENVLKYLISK